MTFGNFIFGLFLKSEEDREVIKRLVRENFGHYRRDYAITVVCLLFSAAMTGFSAWIMGPIVKDVFYGQDFDRAMFLSLVVVFLFIAKGGVSYFQAILMQKIGNNIVARYQRRMFAHMMDMDVSFFSASHSVALVERLNGTINGVREMLNNVLLGYLRDMTTLFGLIAVMIYRDPIMSMIIFIVGPVALTALAGYRRRIRILVRQGINISAQVGASMQQAAHGITVVKSFTMEERMQEQLDALTREAETRANKSARLSARTSPLMETLAGFAIAGVIAYGGYRVIFSGYEPSDLMSFMTALLLAYDPAKRLASMRLKIETSMVNARMVYEVLDIQGDTAREADLPDFVVGPGEIAFEKVSFSYDRVNRSTDLTMLRQKRTKVATVETTPPVIDDVSFRVEPGSTTALVGPSGGGKSTIVSLIQRFYLPSAGKILVDGQSTAGVNSKSLRRSIAYVSQTPIMFEGTVRDNLLYARPNATSEQIEAAARDALAHDFIMELDEGYDTRLGENASNLSGGQRQRLSIARAILRDAPILLLDEATSALDNQSEAKVQSALERLMEGRTTIVIAHRLTTISNADKIVVIEAGRVVQSGKHDDLLADADGLYAKLHFSGEDVLG